MQKLGALALVITAACAAPAARPTPRQQLATPAPAPASPPEPAAAPAPVRPTFRLPGDVVPRAERVELTIVPAHTDAPGHVGIDAEVRRATRVVWLDATDIAVTHATLAGAPARVLAGSDDFVGLAPADGHELAPGPLAIDLDFTAHIDHDKSRGLYSETEGSDAYAYTFFEATDARRAFPCFDEPSDKIPWQLTFHVQRDHVALGNAPVASETAEPGGMKRVVLAPTKPLPSYLVAFIAGPFELVDDGTAGRAQTPIRFAIPKGRAGELAYAKAITPKIVTALEDYFDMPYPYGKLDVAVVPRFWGTMEHPGLLAMGQPLTLIRPDQATRDRREDYANIAAHELSHYWFGDYVTLAWWDDTWLNESFGEWLDAIITRAVEPTWRYELEPVRRAIAALDADETLATQKIRVPVTSPQDIEAAFSGSITYSKGSSILHMFEAYVGADAWRAFIRAWVREHAWGNATSEDMFDAVRAHLGAPLAAGMRSFFDQAGAPRIAMALACAAHGAPALALHQSRALPLGLTDPAPPTWVVPVCVRYGTATGGGARACTLLDKADGTLALPGACPTWIVPNAGADGYYRSAWRGTAELLTPGSPAARAAKLTAAEKLMLLADLRAAGDRGEVPLATRLALAPRVAADADPRVAVPGGKLGDVHLDALPDELFARALRYERGIYAPIVQRLGFARRAADTDDTENLRRDALWIARYDAPLGKQATALALRWFDDTAAFPDDLFDAVFAAAAFHGDAALFDRVLARAQAPRDRNEKQRLVRTLGAFTDPALVDRALALTLSPDFDLRDAITIVYVAIAQRETRDRALAFLAAHLDALLAHMRDDEASWLLGALAESGCDRATHARITQLIAPHAAAFSGAQAAIDQGNAHAEVCIASVERELPELRAFLPTQK